MRRVTRFHLLGLILSSAIFLPPAGFAKNVKVDCNGATPGAFHSLQAAINSLRLAGPNYITVASNPCHEDVRIVDRQRLTIDAPNGNDFITSAEDLGGDAMTITGSTGITLIPVGFYASGRGLVINGNSAVNVLGCTSDSNAGAGLRIDDSNVVVESGAYINNGNAGVLANDSTLTLQDLDISANGIAGIVLHRTHGTITRLNIHDNGAGLLLSNGADEHLDAPNTIVNNQLRGVSVVTGSTLHVGRQHCSRWNSSHQRHRRKRVDRSQRRGRRGLPD
jgi:Periplasmic copper-binding protein (NosD)